MTAVITDYRNGAANWVANLAQTPAEVDFWSGVVEGYETALTYLPAIQNTDQGETFFFADANYHFELARLLDSLHEYGIGMGFWLCLLYVISLE